MTVTQLVAWVKKHNADLGQLEILVEDAKCLEAREICSKGLRAQVKYLMSKMHSSEIRKMIRWEMFILRQHGMKMQSKVVPEHNIPLNGKRKRRNRQ